MEEPFFYNQAEYEEAIEYLAANNRYLKGDRDRIKELVDGCARSMLENPESFYAASGGVLVLIENDNYIRFLIRPSVHLDHDSIVYKNAEEDFLKDN